MNIYPLFWTSADELIRITATRVIINSELMRGRAYETHDLVSRQQRQRDQPVFR